MKHKGFRVVAVKHDDRRKFPRYEVGDLLVGYIGEEDPRKIHVVIKDISRNGIAFYVHKQRDALKRGSTTRLNFYIKGADHYFSCEFDVLDVLIDKKHRFLHRAQVRTGTQNAAALSYLASFIEAVKMSKNNRAA